MRNEGRGKREEGRGKRIFLRIIVRFGSWYFLRLFWQYPEFLVVLHNLSVMKPPVYWL
jgi:hypothetical protein